ncbi:MAG: zinc ribbon domain-containing protein [Candidatus Freyarchaeota archaeon]|nr:zinc ribbon domain-containing protein [Candidatus Jordarchaeia archaeon]MBS7270004.1 zinc ribbon domain-containing protein [Candidatus Jordarchaeia archaeon]MBS7281097.1 zinc ribbon domain-containing protein [Candidatus Jordarchaeia archaeon]
MVSKEAEKMMEDYLKKVERSMTEASKAKKQEVLKTLRAHIMDALQDQKGKMPETEIVKNTIKDLGMPKTESLLQKLVPFIILNIVGLFIIGVEAIAGRGYTFSVPYFVCVFSAVAVWEVWRHTIGERFENRRIDVIGFWLVYLVVIGELFLIEHYIFPVMGPATIMRVLEFVALREVLLGVVNPSIFVDLLLYQTLQSLLVELLLGFPGTGGVKLTSTVALIGGIITVLMSGFLILMPQEFQSKKCSNCGKEVEGNAKFCWSCGEELS